MPASAAALMVLLGIGPIAALKLTLSAFIATAGLGVYGLVYGETRRSDAALISGTVYLFLPYRFTDLFLRGELGEFAAYSIVPFALWGYRALSRVRADRRPLVGALTAIAHGVVWFFHPIVGLILTLIVAVLLPLQAVAARDRREGWQQGLFGGCVVLLATVLASVYLVPAFLEQSLVRLENLWQFCRPTTKYLVNWRALLQFGFFSVGSPTIVGAVVLAAGLIFPPTRRKLANTLVWWVPALLYLPLLTDFRFSVWFWRVSPFGRYLLFPWRLLGFVGLFAAVGIGAMWASLIPKEWRKSGWLGAITLSLLVAISSNGYNRAAFVGAPSTDQLRPEAIRHAGMQTTLVADEYLPRTVTMPPREPKIADVDTFVRLVPDPAMQNPVWVPVTRDLVSAQATKISPLRYAIDVRASQAGSFDLYAFAFPGWKVETLAGPAAARQSTSPLGFIRLSLPVAGHYRLTEYFGSTPLRTVSGLTSLLAFLSVYPFLWYLNRKLLGVHRNSLSSG
ncbi:MAG: hypothetical protein ACREQH_12795 [Candidatus Binatus sp.]